MKHLARILSILGLLFSLQSDAQTTGSDERYRSKIHFSPREKWMNDPNGLVYNNGIYHLFFQHNPNSSVWGPMHWGHATSRDLIHWKQEPIALFPDSIGAIFSGSAVADKNNTSGLGKKGLPPLVAMFTQHNEAGEKAGRTDFQNQSLAYSLDNGKTWKKYSGNPVIKNPGIRDFRDPKLMWHDPSKKWIVSLAAADRIIFYSSPDLKNWSRETEFGETIGAHGGVWECPDLFSLDYNGKPVWVLIVNLNPGGPNKGSATQYFLGDFDGKKFQPYGTGTKWLDYGPDEYAGITWENTGKRKIFLGWMSNWLYANVVPTETWRNAMTVPRELRIVKVRDELFVASKVVSEIAKIKTTPVSVNTISLKTPFKVSSKTGSIKFPCLLDLSFDITKDFSVTISNDSGEELLIGYDRTSNQYFIDRTKSGQTAFQQDFAARHVAPRLSGASKMNLSLLIDVSSVELFADDGLTVMTEIFFPNKPYDKLSITSKDEAVIKKLVYYRLNTAAR